MYACYPRSTKPVYAKCLRPATHYYLKKTKSELFPGMHRRQHLHPYQHCYLYILERSIGDARSGSSNHRSPLEYHFQRRLARLRATSASRSPWRSSRPMPSFYHRPLALRRCLYSRRHRRRRERGRIQRDTFVRLSLRLLRLAAWERA